MPVSDAQKLELMRASGQLGELANIDSDDQRDVELLHLAVTDSNYKRLSGLSSNRLRQLLDKYPIAEKYRWGRAVRSEMRHRQAKDALRARWLGWVVSGCTGALGVFILQHFIR